MAICRRTFLMGATSLLLASCAINNPVGIYRNGRFSLVYKGESTQSISGKFRLKILDNETHLELLTPLSGVIALIKENDDGVSFQKNITDTPIIGRNSEELTQRLLGFPIPISFLKNVLLNNPSNKVLTYGLWRADVIKEDRTSRLISISARLDKATLTVKIFEEKDA